MKRSQFLFYFSTIFFRYFFDVVVVLSQLEGIPDLVSEQGMRKGLYQKVRNIESIFGNYIDV